MKARELIAQLGDLDVNSEVVVMRQTPDGEERSTITGMMTYRDGGKPIAELWVDLL